MFDSQPDLATQSQRMFGEIELIQNFQNSQFSLRNSQKFCQKQDLYKVNFLT